MNHFKVRFFMGNVPKKTKETKKTHKKKLKEYDKDPDFLGKDADFSEEPNLANNTPEDPSFSQELLELDPSVHMIHHVTHFPWGPSLLEDPQPDSTISFEYQDLSPKDLGHTMLDLRGHNSVGKGQIMIVLDTLYDDLEG